MKLCLLHVAFSQVFYHSNGKLMGTLGFCSSQNHADILKPTFSPLAYGIYVPGFKSVSQRAFHGVGILWSKVTCSEIVLGSATLNKIKIFFAIGHL
jgi:hypothetical protein